MKKIIFALALCSILFGEDGKEIARNRATYSTKEVRSKYSGSDLLFILHAKDGHIAMDTTGGYFLTLYGVSKNVTYFSEKPNRKAGKVTTEQFLTGWDKGKHSFRRDSANAGIVTYSNTLGPERFTDFPVVLTNPQYEKEPGRVTFDITRLEKGEMIPTGDLGEVTLFVDTDASKINSQIVD